jgi:hypothetical protein
MRSPGQCERGAIIEHATHATSGSSQRLCVGLWHVFCNEATMAEISTNTPYGPLLTDLQLVTTKDEPYKLPAINPLALLWKAYGEESALSSLMQEKLQCSESSASSPWRLAFYADEVVPGNAISYDNRRKCWVIYFSFMEFGQINLQKEEAWICLLVARSSEINSLQAGISQVMAAVMKLFFVSLGRNIQVAGITLKRDEQHIRFYAKVGMLLQDGGAHKLVWMCKGDSGMKFCML